MNNFEEFNKNKEVEKYESDYFNTVHDFLDKITYILHHHKDFKLAIASLNMKKIEIKRGNLVLNCIIDKLVDYNTGRKGLSIITESKLFV